MVRRATRRPRSLRSHLLALTGVVAVPLVALQIWSGHRELALSEAHAEERALGLATAAAASTRQFLVDTERVLTGLATRYRDVVLDAEDCPGLLGGADAVISSLANLLVLDADAQLVCTAQPIPEGSQVSWTDRRWFRDVAATKSFTVGDPVEGSITRRWVVALAVPIFDERGRFAGTLAGSVDLGNFQELLSGVEIDSSQLVTIADRNNVVLARSQNPKERVGEPLPEGTNPEKILDDGRAIIRGTDLRGVDRIWGKVTLADTRWKVYAGVEAATVLTPIYARFARTGGLTVALLVLAFGLMVLLHRKIAASLTGLVTDARGAAQGKLIHSPPAGPAEIAEVAQQINQMLQARSRAEEAERKSKERYRGMLNHAVFGIYLSTPDGQFLDVNPAMAEMLGFATPEELVAAGPAALYRDPETRRRLVERHRHSGLIEGLEVEWLRRDGTAITVVLNGILVETEDGQQAFEIIVQDVTETKELEEMLRQTQKMEAIGRLAGGVAHDFNNLLMVIGGNAEMLQADLPPHLQQHDGIREISDAVERAEGLTRQLLAFSRKEKSEPRTLAPNDAVRRVEKMLTRLIGEDIELRTRLSPGTPPVRIDPSQFEQVIMNLAVNARDAMPDGGSITIETTAARPPDGWESGGLWARIAVEDTGTGIAREHRPHIFEPFFTTKEQDEGTGLGLATVYGVVTQAGGQVSLNTRYTDGTRLEIFLPGTTQDVEPQPEAPPEAETTEGSGTILAVEDEEQVRRLLHRILTGAGYKVLLASDGVEALEVARTYGGPIDLVITDVVMPNMKGPELARRLAVTRPDLPVLFVSGYTDDHLRQEEIRREPETFLSKPFTPKALVSRVRLLLDRVPTDARLRTG